MIEFFKHISAKVSDGFVTYDINKVIHNPLKYRNAYNSDEYINQYLYYVFKVYIANVYYIINCPANEHRNIEREQNADDCTDKR